MSNKLEFSKLTAEQIRRLDTSLSIYPERSLLVGHEPNITNIVELLSHEECSEKELELAKEMSQTLSTHGIIATVEEFARANRSFSWYGSRFEAGMAPAMGRLAKMMRPRDTVHRARTGPYTGSPPRFDKSYVSKFKLLCEDDRVVSKGSSFTILSYKPLEHGAIDACIMGPTKGRMDVILFPDEIFETSKW